MDWPTAIAISVGIVAACVLCSVMVMAWSGKWDKPRTFTITEGNPTAHYTRTVTEYTDPRPQWKYTTKTKYAPKESKPVNGTEPATGDPVERGT